LKTPSVIDWQRRLSRGACNATFTVLALVSQSAVAQGGPPLVTDDPETPGDGHWEINLAAIGTHTSGRREIAAPDADINYGWGEHVQLKVDVPWVLGDETGQRWKSGLGAPNVGVKWRFIDIEDSGFSMSTYPQYTRNWLSSSASRGISAPGGQLFLPIEASTVLHEYSLDAEAGVNLVQYGSTQLVAGAIVAHSCGRNLECLGEVRRVFVSHDSQTLLNFGLHWKLDESMVVLAAAGREFGPRTDDQQRLLVYLGLQLLR
jgi:hypothetical protein